MLAIKAQFDGKQVVMPSVPSIHKCPVIVIFEDDEQDRNAWQSVQESALSKVWENNEDAVYDTL